MERRMARVIGAAVVVVGLGAVPSCTQGQTACAGVGLNGPVADSPEGARDAFLRKAFQADPSATYPDWKQIRRQRDRVTYRAPSSPPPTEASSTFQLWRITVTSTNGGWAATDNC